MYTQKEKKRDREKTKDPLFLSIGLGSFLVLSLHTHSIFQMLYMHANFYHHWSIIIIAMRIFKTNGRKYWIGPSIEKISFLFLIKKNWQWVSFSSCYAFCTHSGGFKLISWPFFNKIWGAKLYRRRSMFCLANEKIPLLYNPNCKRDNLFHTLMTWCKRQQRHY